jgi:hypothetical protein
MAGLLLLGGPIIPFIVELGYSVYNQKMIWGAAAAVLYIAIIMILIYIDNQDHSGPSEAGTWVLLMVYSGIFMIPTLLIVGGFEIYAHEKSKDEKTKEGK